MNIIADTLRGMRVMAYVALCCGALTSDQQDSAATDHGSARTVSLAGTVLDAETGTPITESLKLKVFGPFGLANSTQFTRDFRVDNLSPGVYILEVAQEGNRFPIGRRTVAVFKTTAVDLYVRLYGGLSGTVHGPGSQAVAGSRVLLVAPEYWFGRIAYYAERKTLTDDRGYYFFNFVKTGKSYLLLVLPPGGDPSAAESGNPEPGRRPSVLAATWYPERPGTANTLNFSLSSGQKKTIDLQMSRSSSLCMSGVTRIDGKPASTRLEIDLKEIGGYAPAIGLDQGEVGEYSSESNGSFSFCDLWPDDYLVKVRSTNDIYGYLEVNMSRSNLTGIVVDAWHAREINGDVEWDKPKGQMNEKATLILSPVSRQGMIGEPFPQITIDGSQPFSSKVLAMTEYSVAIMGPPGTYLKQVSCGNELAVANRINSEMNACKLHVVIGTDRRTVTATIVDKDKQEITDAVFCLVPMSALSRDAVAGGAACAETGELEGAAGSAVLHVPPGKYYGLVRQGPQPLDWVEDLWKRIPSGLLVDTQGASTSVTVELK